ncbi:MAG: lipoprotein [Leptospiraceae bacterium]|nr:lipoprotein [Leptospiraceae bacterium]
MRILFLFFFVSCFNKYSVEIAKQDTKKSKVIIGYIENRDILLTRYTAKNFKDMLEYEFLKAGYSVPDFQKPIEKELEEETQNKSELGDLPKTLRKVAGENSFYENKEDRFLKEEEIAKLITTEKANLFLQGAIAIHSNERILDKRDHNFIFLNIFDKSGKRVGMISSAFEDKVLYEATLLREVCRKIVKEFQESFK